MCIDTKAQGSIFQPMSFPSQHLNEKSVRKWQALQAIRNAQQITMSRSAFRNYTIKIFLSGFLTASGGCVAAYFGVFKPLFN